MRDACSEPLHAANPGGPPEMTKVVAIASPKGGTGKSMLTALLGSEAAAVGKKVLMIDADPQQTLTLWKAQCEVNDIPLTNMEFAHIAFGKQPTRISSSSTIKAQPTNA